MQVILQLYMMTCIVTICTMLYINSLIKTDADFFDKCMLVFDNMEKEPNKLTLIAAIIPIINILITAFLIWFIRNPYDKVKSFYDWCNNDDK